MSDITTDQPDRPDRSKPALVGAALLLVVVVALVLVFGIARPPALPSLADVPDPAPPAAVAWTTFDRDDGPCLYVARPDGTTGSLDCNLDGEVWAWDDDGIAVFTYRAHDEIEIIDPATGAVVERREVGDGERPGPSRAGTVSSQHRDGTLVVTRDDTREVIWEIDAPEGYRVGQGAVSPDGDWVAMFDSAERLLLVPADGSADPRVWAEDTTEWEVPVWEGSSLPTGTS